MQKRDEVDNKYSDVEPMIDPGSCIHSDENDIKCCYNTPLYMGR